MAPKNTTATAIATAIVKYGDHEMAVADIHPASLVALIQKGFSHGMGNEVASKVGAAKAKAEKDGKPWGDAETATATHDFRNEYMDRLRSGDVGTGRSGVTRGDALARMIKTVATEFAKAAVKKQRPDVPWGKVKNADEIVAKFAGRDDVKAEAQRRLDTAGADVDVDITIE